MRLDGYIRVSKVGGREGPSFISPQIQQDEIEAWARFKHAEILEFHQDLDESGGRVERPGLEQALARAERGETGGIVVAKLDRLARSLTGALETIKRLDDASAEFISVAEGLDPTTPAGKMMMRLMLVMAEFELDRFRETWEQSRRRAVARGLHISPIPPTGYRRGPGGRLVLDPTAAPQVAECFRMRAAYRSWPEIFEFISSNGLKNPYGEAKWRIPSLLALMANRVYLGEARSGSFSLPGAHEPLIDRGTWELAQVTRTLTAVRSCKPALLSGLLRCAGCRRSMGPNPSTSGRWVTRYCCKDRKSWNCPQRSVVGGRAIEEYVVDQFFSLYERSLLRRAAREDSRQNAESALRAAESCLGELHERAAATAEEAALAETAVAHARARVIELTRSTLLPSPTRLRALWSKLPVGERRRCLALLFDAVVVRSDRGRGLADRVLLMPFGEGPDELPPRGKSARLAPIEWDLTA